MTSRRSTPFAPGAAGRTAALRRLLLGAALIAAGTAFGCGGNGSPNDFTLSAQTPTIHVVQGGSASYALTASSGGGFSGPVSLSISGLPAGAAGGFAPATVSPSPTGVVGSTLTVTTSGGETPTPTGSYPLTVTGAGGGLSRQINLTLVVDPPAPVPGSLNGTIQ